MKKLIHLFVNEEVGKSFEQFTQLSYNDMLIVKGGDGEPKEEDLIPPMPPMPPTKP